MTDDDMKLLAAIAKGDYGHGADDIAFYMGYRPSRKGRLAVTTKMRALNRAHPKDPPDQWNNDGLYIYRRPPKDQWDHARWGLTHAGHELLKASKGST